VFNTLDVEREDLAKKERSWIDKLKPWVNVPPNCPNKGDVSGVEQAVTLYFSTFFQSRIDSL
jgi:hypothetical protein